MDHATTRRLDDAHASVYTAESAFDPGTLNNGATAREQGTVRKHRVALACKRCKRRKQRCDGSEPTCRSCNKAGVSCEYERVLRPQYPGGKSLYITSLEERIAFLEGQLPDYAEDHLTYVDGAEGHTHDIDIPEQGDQLSRNIDEPLAEKLTSFVNEQQIEDHDSLVDGVAYLSLYASGVTDSAPEPYFLGSSSGATIARLIQSSVFRNSANASKERSEASNSIQPVDDIDLAQSPDSYTSTSHTLEFPGKDVARALFDVFFDRIHTRWPLLDRGLYTKSFEKQYVHNGLSVTESSIFHLIYGITARFLALTGKPCGIDSDCHLTAATEHMSHILERHSIATIQFLLLLGVHGQRSPYGAGAWSQIRYAMSMCIEMGLHRKRSSVSTPEQRKEDEVRRRAFWCCYSLDRSIGVVLGRPFALADRDINAELPSQSPEFAELTHHRATTDKVSHWSNVAPFVHIIRLERIISRIHKTVFRIDQDVLSATPASRAKLDRKVSGLCDDLDMWLQECPQTPKELNKSTWMYDPENAYLDASDFYGLQYHKAVLFLHTIFLPSLEPSDTRFTTCISSAAAVCNAYKRLNQNRTLTYTMISLHSTFTAGLTLVYCLWRDRSLLTFEAFDALRACSQSLTIFGEKWSGAIKYRDLFDVLSDSLFKAVMNPGGSTSRLATSHTLAAQTAAPPVVNGRAGNESQPSQNGAAGNHNLAQMMSDAVKEAFMEVDEEAPGGWQGSRMWQEMAGNGVSAPASHATFRPAETDSTTNESGWASYHGASLFGNESMQSAHADFDDMAAQWHFDTLE